MESKTAKKKFCSDLHRLYYHRELKRGTLEVDINFKTPNKSSYDGKSISTLEFDELGQCSINSINMYNRVPKNTEDKIPKGLHWKQQLEWIRNNKKKK